MTTENKEKEEGKKAYLAGRKFHRNPYWHEETDLARKKAMDWSAGWRNAERASRDG